MQNDIHDCHIENELVLINKLGRRQYYLTCRGNSRHSGDGTDHCENVVLDPEMNVVSMQQCNSIFAVTPVGVEHTER